MATAISVAPARAEITTISIAGSTSLFPIVREAAEDYQRAHADIQINVTQGGSKAGLAQLAAHSIDVANSDIGPAHTAELVDHLVAAIGFALYVNASAGVQNLTRAQVKQIYSGKATNWKQVGGADLPIVAIDRPHTSATYAVFAQTFLDGGSAADGLPVEDSSPAAAAAVKATPGAIGYGSLSVAQKSALQAVRLDGIVPSNETIAAGSYPFFSYEHMVTNGAPSKEISRFLAFIETKRTLLLRYGYIPVRDLPSHLRERYPT